MSFVRKSTLDLASYANLKGAVQRLAFIFDYGGYVCMLSNNAGPKMLLGAFGSQREIKRYGAYLYSSTGAQPSPFWINS